MRLVIYLSQIVSEEDERVVVWNDSDLDSVCDKLRLVSVDDEPKKQQADDGVVDFSQSDEELARMLQVWFDFYCILNFFL